MVSIAVRMDHRHDGHWVYFKKGNAVSFGFADLSQATEWCQANLEPHAWLERMNAITFKKLEDALLCFIAFK